MTIVLCLATCGCAFIYSAEAIPGTDWCDTHQVEAVIDPMPTDPVRIGREPA